FSKCFGACDMFCRNLLRSFKIHLLWFVVFVPRLGQSSNLPTWLCSRLHVVYHLATSIPYRLRSKRWFYRLKLYPPWLPLTVCSLLLQLMNAIKPPLPMPDKVAAENTTLQVLPLKLAEPDWYLL